MLGLAIKLKQHGHRVTLATNGYFESLIRKHEIEFEELGTKELYFTAIQHPDLWHPRRAFPYLFSFIQPVLQRQYEILVERAAAGPIVGLSSCLGFGARMAQESHGIPVITVHLQPAVIWSDAEPPVFPNLFGPRWLKRLFFRMGEKFAVDRLIGKYLDPWRKQLGLSAVRHALRWWNSPTGVLCLFPDWYAAPQLDWPQPLMQTDFPLWNDGSHLPLLEPVQEFLDAGDPPLVFTPGTANLHGREFFATAVAACQQLKRRGIFLTRHPEQLPSSLPDSIRHLSYVPLDLLLSRSAAFIHHGGIGSTSQALLAGIPQVIMPLAHDQFDNAARVEKLRAGQGLPVKSFTPRKLAEILQSQMNSSQVADACRQAKNRLSTHNGLEETVQTLEARYC